MRRSFPCPLCTNVPRKKSLFWLIDSFSSLSLSTGRFWRSSILPPCCWTVVCRRYNQLGTRVWPRRLPRSVHTCDLYQGVDVYIPAFLKRKPRERKLSKSKGPVIISPEVVEFNFIASPVCWTKQNYFFLQEQCCDTPMSA